MNSKEAILQALRDAAPQPFPKPDLSALKADSLRYPDNRIQFCRALAGSGGKTATLLASVGAFLPALFAKKRRPRKAER